MVKRMLIDATHVEETRVVVLNGQSLEEFDVETSTKKQIKGNIYLAKVTRVEPSLQAAFVEYGGDRHGFLAFAEIHPDYYRIPVADREALLEESLEVKSVPSEDGEEGEAVEEVGGDAFDDVTPRRSRLLRHYKIQDVIERRQIMLVQVVKEERGNKGAALTTYISLAGRYCVLMPNNPRGGGVSRKILSGVDRKRLKMFLDEFNIPERMAVIVRTAGMERSRLEIHRDYEYLMRLWEEIRQSTLHSVAPKLIYEEGDLIKRAIRDLYSEDIEQILVEGEEGFQSARNFMRMMIPNHARRVIPYKDPTIPLMHRYQVENQLDQIHSPVVNLRSGGYVVINPTEALVSIDVNSGRATRERHIEETAYKTNIEAAEEIARQLRLRDLAGLIVIDFIDMEESRNVQTVERKLKEAMKSDRARIQIGRISAFGLLELSRQRLRPSILEAHTGKCPHCNGTGVIRSTESTAISILRVIEEEGIRNRFSEILVYASTEIALYLLNQKRDALSQIEKRYRFRVQIDRDDSLIPPAHRIQRLQNKTAEQIAELAALAAVEPAVYEPDPEDVDPDEEACSEDQSIAGLETESWSETTEKKEEDDRPRRRSRRHREGEAEDSSSEPTGKELKLVSEGKGEEVSDVPPSADEEETPLRRRRVRRNRRRRPRRDDSQNAVAMPLVIEETSLEKDQAPALSFDPAPTSTSGEMAAAGTDFVASQSDLAPADPAPAIALAAAPAKSRSRRKKPEEPAETAPGIALAAAPAKSRSRRKKPEEPAETAPGIALAAAPAKSRSRRKKPEEPAETAPGIALAAAPAKSRSRRKKPEEPAETAPGIALAAAPAKSRSRRKAASETPSENLVAAAPSENLVAAAPSENLVAAAPSENLVADLAIKIVNVDQASSPPKRGWWRR